MRTRHRLRRGWPRAVAIGGVVVAVVVLAFFVRGFDSTGPDEVALPPAGTSAPSVAPSPSSSVTQKARTSGAQKYVVPGTKQTITLGAEAPGLVIDTSGEHRITLTAVSAEPLYGVGYLMPTSLDHPYGKTLSPGAQWSVTTTVSGRPYYAVLWIAAGSSGAPATCTITLDGKVAARKTTVGRYGRQVCYA